MYLFFLLLAGLSLFQWFLLQLSKVPGLGTHGSLTGLGVFLGNFCVTNTTGLCRDPSESASQRCSMWWTTAPFKPLENVLPFSSWSPHTTSCLRGLICVFPSQPDLRVSGPRSPPTPPELHSGLRFYLKLSLRKLVPVFASCSHALVLRSYLQVLSHLIFNSKSKVTVSIPFLPPPFHSLRFPPFCRRGRLSSATSQKVRRHLAVSPLITPITLAQHQDL